MHHGFGVFRKGDSFKKPSAGMKVAKFIFIDEISMVSPKLFLLSSKSMNREKSAAPSAAFGGVHVCCFGDFYQLPPVKSNGMYQESCTSNSSQLVRAGRLLWAQQFESVLFLDQQMRAKADVAYARALMHIREGTRDDATIALLTSRVFDNLPESERNSPLFKTAKIVTLRNPLRQAFNNDHAKTMARQLGVPLLVSHAEDVRCLGKHVRVPLRADDRMKALQLADNKTGNLPGYLPLVLGMEYFIKQNINADMGCTNGQAGILDRIILDPREKIPAGADAGEEIHLRFQPLALLWRHSQRPDKQAVFHGLDDGELIPILPQKQKFEFKRGNGTMIGCERVHCPLGPLRAITAHGSQGSTFDAIAIDALDVGINVQNAIYVLLSRVRSSEHLLIQRPFAPSSLFKKPDLELLKEMKRLHTCQAKLVQKLRKQFAAELLIAAK